MLRANIRVDTEGTQGRQDIVAVAGWDMEGLPTVILINTRFGMQPRGPFCRAGQPIVHP